MKAMFTKRLRGGLLAASLTVLLAGPALAQNSSGARYDDDNRGADKHTYWGIRGGLNLTNFWNRGTGLNDASIRPGFHVGLFARTQLAEILWIQPELQFSTKGSRYEYSQGRGQGLRAQNFNLHYLELPILFKLQPLKTFNIHAGPYGAFLMRASQTNQDREDPQIIPGDETRLNRDSFNQIDYGFTAGLELNLKNFDVGTRFSIGLRDVGRTQSAREQTMSGRNNNFQVYVGFAF